MIRNECNQSEAFMKKDQRHMTKGFREAFDSEVDVNDGFMKGGKSFLTQFPEDRDNCEIAVCCLARGNYAVYRTTPHEIVRRMDNKKVYSPDLLDEQYVEAECYFIFDLLEPEVVNTLSEEEKGSLVWFIKEAITGGAVVVIPAPNQNADLNVLGESFGEFIEQTFEVFHGKASKRGKR